MSTSSTRQKYSVGIDIGGTKMSAVLWNGEKAIADSRLSTPKNNLEDFYVIISALIAPLLERARNDNVKVSGIGLGIAGSLDRKNETMLSSGNIPVIGGARIAEEVTKRTGLPAKMENDARCFIMAEALHGAGKKYKSVYGIILGTGFGGAWWNGSSIHSGSHNGAGEPSRMIVNFTKNIELEEAYHQIFQNNPAKFAEEAIRGDELAQKKFDEFGRILGIALSNIANIIDPEVFIIGGGVSESADLFLNIARKTMKMFIASPESKDISVITGKLSPHAGAIGAALLV